MKIKPLAGVSVLILLFADCRSKPPVNDAKPEPLVTVCNPVMRSFSAIITFNGVTQYQQKAVIRAGIAGYINHRGWKTGDLVKAGGVYCTITSKEQQALKGLDQEGILAKFKNPIPVIAGTGGVLTAVNYQNGDFVAEGDILATLTQQSSLVVLVNVPLEYLDRVTVGTECTILTPDGRKLNGRLQSGLPAADPTVQTKSFIVPIASTDLPEGANLKINIALSNPVQALAVPVNAVQTDEIQQHFWVFKLSANDQVVKVDVQAGKISADSLQEIRSGEISVNDKIVVNGAYGLADSSKVKLQK